MASSAKHGRLTEFHPGVDTVDDYEDRFLLYCDANGIGEGPKRKAIFLTSVGAMTYTLLKNLVSPQKPQELELKALVALLKTHYQPKIIVIAERFRFYKRQQRDSETITSYLADLRRLAKDCQFGGCLSTALRDQMVCGLNTEALQQKLLAEANLTLDKAVEIAQAYEAATQETKVLRRNPLKQTGADTAFRLNASATGGPRQVTSPVSGSRQLTGKKTRNAIDVVIMVTIRAVVSSVNRSVTFARQGDIQAKFAGRSADRKERELSLSRHPNPPIKWKTMKW